MRKWRIRQTADINDVRAGSPHCRRARDNRVHVECRRIDDFGEDPDVIAGQIDAAAVPSEKSRQILHFIGATNERDAKFRCEPFEVSATAAGHHHPIRVDRARQPAQDDRFRHQRRHFHADVEYRPRKTKSIRLGEDSFQP